MANQQTSRWAERWWDRCTESAGYVYLKELCGQVCSMRNKGKLGHTAVQRLLLVQPKLVWKTRRKAQLFKPFEQCCQTMWTNEWMKIYRWRIKTSTQKPCMFTKPICQHLSIFSLPSPPFFVCLFVLKCKLLSNFQWNRDLEYRDPIFSHDTLAFWWCTIKLFRTYGKKHRISSHEPENCDHDLQVFTWHSGSWWYITIPCLVIKGSALQNISSGDKQSLKCSIVSVALTLMSRSNPIFTLDILANDDTPSKQVWLQKEQQFKRSSRSCHILIMQNLLLTLTLKIANNVFRRMLQLTVIHRNTYQTLVQKVERLGRYCWRKLGHTDTPTSAYHYCPPPPTSLWGLEQITTCLCCNRTVSFTAYSYTTVNAFAFRKIQIFWSCRLRVVVFSLLFVSSEIRILKWPMFPRCKQQIPSMDLATLSKT